MELPHDPIRDVRMRLDEIYGLHHDRARLDHARVAAETDLMQHRSFAIFCRSIAMAAVGIGAGILLVLIGVSVLLYVRPFGAETSSLAIPHASVAAMGAHEPPPATVSRTDESTREVANYVLFRKVPVTIGDRQLHVWTGIQFASNRAEKPDAQWCYLDVGVVAGHISRQVELAKRDEDGRATYTPLAEVDAAVLGVPLSSLLGARASCRFEA